jgi:hypothetical protein
VIEPLITVSIYLGSLVAVTASMLILAARGNRAAKEPR